MPLCKPIILNLFAGPGAGKSSLAADVFAELKWHGVNCEIVTEVAKELAWINDGRSRDQLYIIGNQMERVDSLLGKVDVIVTDSPVMMALAYCPPELYHGLKSHLEEWTSKYDNFNVRVIRTKPYNPLGRFQDEAAAKKLDNIIADLPVFIDRVYPGEKMSTPAITQDILTKLSDRLKEV